MIPPEQRAPVPTPWKRLARAAAPWVVALLVLGWVLSRTPLEAAAAALGRIDLGTFLVLTAAYSLSLWLSDTCALVTAFRATLPANPIPYGSLLWVRAASYLLSLVSYGAGQGGVVYFAHRRHGLSLSNAASAVLLATGCFVLVIGLAVGMGAALGAIPNDPVLALAAYLTSFALPAYLAVIAWSPAFLADRRLLAPLFAARVAGTLRVCAARGVHLACLIGGHWAALALFGVDVPLASALARLPVLFFIASLPIAPSGLGTTQAAAVVLFAEYAPGADEGTRAAVVVAYSLSLHVGGSLMTFAIGLLGMRRGGATGKMPKLQG